MLLLWFILIEAVSHFAACALQVKRRAFTKHATPLSYYCGYYDGRVYGARYIFSYEFKYASKLRFLSKF